MTVEKQLEQINKLIFVRSFDESRRLLNALAKLHPSNMLVQLRRIELAAKLKELTVLSDEYSRLAESSGSSLSLELCQILVGLHGESLDPNEAIVRLQKIIQTHGDQSVAYYGIGYSLEMRGNIDRAFFNYERSVASDPHWYPSYFGLSQLCYQRGDAKTGDQYFMMFEQAAPYNVYGNFDTHRSISQEFMEAGRYREAEVAITSLSEWWTENKGRCPQEIQLFENLSLARIHAAAGDQKKSSLKHQTALSIADSMVNDPQIGEGVVYFAARCLEDFSEFETALKLYKKALRIAGNNPVIVQKIGGQFLALGEYQLALDLFKDAYEVFPDNPEVRFCILVARMKLAGVNVEDYLIGKERLKQLSAVDADRVEILALLHSLMAKFQEDPDIHQQMADIYLRLGNIERSGRHYLRMFELDPLSRQSGLRYVGFHMNYGNPEEAVTVLEKITKFPDLTVNEQTEIFWLRANYFARKNDFLTSQQSLSKALIADPWNVSYLVLAITNHRSMARIDADLQRDETTLQKLARLEEDGLDWSSFDRLTSFFEEENLSELVYLRNKLRFLYSSSNDKRLSSLVNAALRFDPKAATTDFLKLINTNFDSPNVYFGLGQLYKELWQLEVAEMWFEQCIAQAGVSKPLKAQSYAEIADCLVWMEKNFKLALEYGRLALDLGFTDQAKIQNTLTHIYLKLGQVKSAAEISATLAQSQDYDARFLRGLIEYRNGSKAVANEIWKPLLTVKADSLRFHHIKQEILKFYFDSVPYFRAN